MQGPAADTFNYMIAGFTVIFGVMGAYLLSLGLRWRALKREQDMLEEVSNKDSK